jgi:hypothetical protein
VPPSLADPRLHTAAVIISIHTIGITALGFEVTVPQILAAILTSALIDVAFTLWRTRQLVWPASGMLTGSGVGLILRYVPTGSHEYWGWEGWYWFALIAGLSILTKHFIRWRGDHIFNPSNLGLVVAFLIIGSGTIEPLDFWWAPLGLWMAIAYVIIIGGGALITRRLHLLEMAVTFWGMLIAGIGLLALSGHCMIATWSVTPVCDGRFWSTLATSPEVLIFLFFMITDPKTIPQGRPARVTFSAVLAALATVLIAPNGLEYGAKVGLLASLVLLSPVRRLFDRLFVTESHEGSGIKTIVSRLSRVESGTARVFSRGAALGSGLVLVGALILLAGTPAREPATAEASAPSPTPPLDPELTTVPTVDIDPTSIPPVEIDPSVNKVDIELNEDIARDLALRLAENLMLEAKAMRTADTDMLRWADGGRRLDAVQALMDEAITTGRRPVDMYRFDTLVLRSAGESEGQTTAALAFEATGTTNKTVYNAAGDILDSTTEPFSLLFVIRQPLRNRWLIVDIVEL